MLLGSGRGKGKETGPYGEKKETEAAAQEKTQHHSSQLPRDLGTKKNQNGSQPASLSNKKIDAGALPYSGGSLACCGGADAV